MVPLSPLSRKRGRVAVSTTGSRTVTSIVARPSLVEVHATAITRAVPANSGMSKLISAVPSAPTVTMPGIERQRLLRGRAALQLGAGGIAAGPDLAAGALHAVDQLPVEVADLRGHAALAEIVIVRRRRLVIGQVENADIDGGDDDLGVLAGIEPAELDRNLQRACPAAPAAAATRSTVSVRVFLSMPNHFRPIARPGIRRAAASSGRRSVATT